MAKKTRKSTKDSVAPTSNGLPDVMTIEEAGAFLRLPPSFIEKEAANGQIPGRYIADNWRFLAVALVQWLQGQIKNPLPTDWAACLASDDTWEQMLDEIYARRRRSWRQKESVA